MRIVAFGSKKCLASGLDHGPAILYTAQKNRIETGGFLSLIAVDSLFNLYFSGDRGSLDG
jgi:hypothetical protein